MFENGLLKKLFGFRWVGLSRGWRKLYIEKLYDLCCLPNVIKVKKGRSTKWVASVAHMRENGYVEIVVG
jgi:hypothetical protein